MTWSETHGFESASRRLLLSLVFTAPALAGGSGENALLIVDPTSSDALWAANHYRAARQIPEQNLLYMDPGATNYASFVSVNQKALLDEIDARGLTDHIDYIVVMPGANFYVPASGHVADGCVGMFRFGIAGAYSSTFVADEILGGGLSYTFSNRYRTQLDTIEAFDSEWSYFNGQVSSAPNSRRYFLSSLLGYTGERGNTMPEILDMIDRSVAVDGTFPVGTTYFMHTTDEARSSPRHNTYPSIASKIIAEGGNALRLFDVLPLTNHDCLGVMTGWASPGIDGADMTLLPGSFADHLTSYAGRFDTASQVKMSRWIAKGASATSGTVEEPCAIAGKFPHARLHLYYFKGLSMGEAWFRSMSFFPFQNLLLGDPLTRPFSAAPIVDLPGAPASAVSGSVVLHPTAMATAPGANIAHLEVLLDGRLYRRLDKGQGFAIPTTTLSDGWHDLRVLAYDDTAARNVGRWLGSFEVNNLGRSSTLSVNTSMGDQAQAFDFSVAAQGAPVELRLIQSERVIAATASNPDTLRLYGVNLGAGPARVQLEARYTDGSLVRSAPLELDVSEAGIGTSGNAPLAFSFERELRPDGLRWIELPAVFDDDLDSASFTVVTPPAQGTLVSGVSGGYRLLDVGAGASGTDTLIYRVTTPSGVSADATITLRYENPFDCPTPTKYCVGAMNSGGFAAAIGSGGSPSLTSNDFTVTVAGAISNQFGLFFYGAGQVQAPLGDGFLCVGAGGAGIFRLPPPSLAGFFGDNEEKLDLNTAPFLQGAGAIEPGSTWNFQYWYRDSGGTSGFNLSDGLSVTFCP